MYQADFRSLSMCVVGERVVWIGVERVRRPNGALRVSAQEATDRLRTNSHKNELETRISKFVMRMVRHEDLHDRETDVAVRWKIDGSEAEMCVPEVWEKYLH